MYSGEAIDFEALANGDGYDIDHIFPQSKVKDDSIDNRVLVKSDINQGEKKDIYPQFLPAKISVQFPEFLSHIEFYFRQ